MTNFGHLVLFLAQIIFLVLLIDIVFVRYPSLSPSPAERVGLGRGLGLRTKTRSRTRKKSGAKKRTKCPKLSCSQYYRNKILPQPGHLHIVNPRESSTITCGPIAIKQVVQLPPLNFVSGSSGKRSRTRS